ncbi:MAG TPA: acyl carrier protein [Puia sp.]|jgi:acyl carrier protein|nr:acyl carrier protein [Puia sp.]
MEKDQVLAKVNDICRDVFSDPKLTITAASSARDVASWDSMTNLFLIDALEQQFRLKFKLDEIMNAQNVGELCDIIVERGQI